MARSFSAETSISPSVAMDSIASASLSLAISTSRGILPKVGAIRAHASLNACPIAVMVSGPNDAPSINARAFIPHLHFWAVGIHEKRGSVSPLKRGFPSGLCHFTKEKTARERGLDRPLSAEVQET